MVYNWANVYKFVSFGDNNFHANATATQSHISKTNEAATPPPAEVVVMGDDIGAAAAAAVVDDDTEEEDDDDDDSCLLCKYSKNAVALTPCSRSASCSTVSPAALAGPWTVAA